jgi:hypothetical protein
MTRNEILKHREAILRQRRHDRRWGHSTPQSEAIAAARLRLALRYVARADVQRFGHCHADLAQLLAKPF